MAIKKQVKLGKFYNGFKTETYDVTDFNIETLRNLPFYYDESTIYFSLIEDNIVLKTIFIKNKLPAIDFYNLICAYNPNPLSMEPISFEIKVLPESLHAISIIDFDKEYNYNIEIKTTNNYQEVAKAFLQYLEQMIPELKNKLNILNIFDSNPFDFAKYGKQSNSQILSFLVAFECNYPSLKSAIRDYRQYLLYKEMTALLNQEEINTTKRA